MLVVCSAASLSPGTADCKTALGSVPWDAHSPVDDANGRVDG